MWRDRCLRAETVEGPIADVPRAIGAIASHEHHVPEPMKARVGERLARWCAVVAVGVDRDRHRISRSIMRTRADPLEWHLSQLETGQTVDATITRVMR
jgi:hypothetical protein